MTLFTNNKLTLVVFFSSLTLAVLTACSDKEATNTGKTNVNAGTTASENNSDQVLTIAEQAANIAKNNIIIDTHIDVPYRLDEEYEDVSKATAKGDFDYPRAVKGGLDAPFMSIYIPSKLQKLGGSKALADKLIDDVENIVAQSPDGEIILTLGVQAQSVTDRDRRPDWPVYRLGAPAAQEANIIAEYIKNQDEVERRKKSDNFQVGF